MEINPQETNTHARLRTVAVTRYVTPLREGGSVPAIVEADDDGMYVLKFRGAAQGAKVLVAEIIAGELGRALGLPVPEIVLAELDADLARTEPDPEIQRVIAASGGINVALDYLPGAAKFDPVVFAPDARLASEIVWFDALVANVDRTARNTNMLMWHRRLQLIDHGAALYFHHDWDDYLARSRGPFERIKEHVLLPFATRLAVAHESLLPRLTPDEIQAIVAQVPDALLANDGTFATPAQHRAAYNEYLPGDLSRRMPLSRRRFVRTLCSYDYAIVRVVPRVDREEFINAGVVLSCPEHDFLDARIELDERRLLALDPGVDIETVRANLASIPVICAGGPAAGSIGQLSPRERFHWLVAPRSTMIQMSPVHSGRCREPAQILEHLVQMMVRAPHGRP